jgi:hypothetical protein
LPEFPENFLPVTNFPALATPLVPRNPWRVGFLIRIERRPPYRHDNNLMKSIIADI